MKKFLVLYKSSVPASEQMARATLDQMKAGMDLWMSWAKKAGSAVVDLGSPLGSPMKVIGGLSTAGNGNVTGFSILQAESGKAIASLMKEHPHFKAPGASVEVLEFLPMPGMPQQ